MSELLNVVGHPLILHKLTIMRRKDTTTDNFRRLLREIAQLLAYEVTRDLPLELVPIETPLAAIDAPQISGKKLCLVSILRAGNGMLDGMLDILPAARVGHIGLYRDPATLAAVEYYFKVPEDIAERLVIVVDPMLATGHSAAAALTRLKAAGAATIKYVCLLAAPEGVASLHAAHPDVPIYTAAVDDHLNAHGYIVPGLGDAGDRLVGTKSRARAPGQGRAASLCTAAVNIRLPARRAPAYSDRQWLHCVRCRLTSFRRPRRIFRAPGSWSKAPPPLRPGGAATRRSASAALTEPESVACASSWNSTPTSPARCNSRRRVDRLRRRPRNCSGWRCNAACACSLCTHEPRTPSSRGTSSSTLRTAPQTKPRSRHCASAAR